MRALKWLGIVFAVYVGIVVVFELFLGLGQPKAERMPYPMIVLITTDASGASHERRLARFDSGGQAYVSAHHWPRAWYRRALENPEVRVRVDGGDGSEAPYTAIPVEGEEYARVVEEYPIRLPGRILMGFAPRRLLRLDPRP